MKVLLVKPRSAAAKFGLAPFFQTEPLGLEYIATALEQRGHTAFVVDLRYEKRSLTEVLEARRPQLVGISCLHILDAPEALRLAREVKAFDASIFVAVGGHAASAYPDALAPSDALDAICFGEGEEVAPALCDALQNRLPLDQVPALLLPAGNGAFRRTAGQSRLIDLAAVQPPDRSAVASYQRHYCCLNYMPVWTLETARGCPHRCKFCSVWQFYRRTHRFHAPDAVRADFQRAGHNVFVIDDIFWAEKSHSEELARALLGSPARKNWMLVQSRADLVADNPDLLELWRPLARRFDIFFGFESPNTNALAALDKGTEVAKTAAAIEVARRLGYGVTGNFIVDSDSSEDDFLELWEFLRAHRLDCVGFTILTPLPGTYFFEQVKSRIEVFDWSQYDLHHLLWRPRLPVERFFELYCETWRRSVLNLAGGKKWWRWLREVELRQVFRLLRILARTQRLMEPKTYLAETRIASETSPLACPRATPPSPGRTAAAG